MWQFKAIFGKLIAIAIIASVAGHLHDLLGVKHALKQQFLAGYGRSSHHNYHSFNGQHQAGYFGPPRYHNGANNANSQIVYIQNGQQHPAHDVGFQGGHHKAHASAGSTSESTHGLVHQHGQHNGNAFAGSTSEQHVLPALLHTPHEGSHHNAHQNAHSHAGSTAGSSASSWSNSNGHGGAQSGASAWSNTNTHSGGHDGFYGH